MQNIGCGGEIVAAFVVRTGPIGRHIPVCGVVAGAMLLAACAARDPVVVGANTAPAGNWQIERQVDRITGAPISSALLVTRTVSNVSIPFPPPAQMQLLCFKDQPAVLLAFKFKIGSTRNAEFSYRFDEKPGHVAQVRFADDYMRVIIEDRSEVTQFITEMADSKLLYVLVRSLSGESRRTRQAHQRCAAPPCRLTLRYILDRGRAARWRCPAARAGSRS